MEKRIVLSGTGATIKIKTKEESEVGLIDNKGSKKVKLGKNTKITYAA